MSFAKPFWRPADAQAVLFDWDGVIAQTRLDFTSIREKYFGGKRVMLLEEGAKLPPPLRDELMRELDEIETQGASSCTSIAGAREILGELRERRIATAVISRNSAESIRLAASRMGDLRLPEIVLGRNDCPYVKPDPRVFHEVVSRLGVSPSECVYVGDYLYDLMAARRCGFRGVLVERTEPAWDVWHDAAFPTLQDFYSAFISGRTFVAWEYRELAGRIGEEALRRRFARCLKVPEHPVPSLACWLHEAAAQGAGTLAVSRERQLDPELWKANPVFTPESMGLALHEAVARHFRLRYPFLSVRPLDELSDSAVRAPDDAADLAAFFESAGGE